MASCRRRAVPRPHVRRSKRPKAQSRGPLRRFQELRPLPRSGFRASPRTSRARIAIISVMFAPHNSVLQPVVQFRTAIHGKSLSGGALNRVQKLLHVAISSPSCAKSWLNTVPILTSPAAAPRVAQVTSDHSGLLSGTVKEIRPEIGIGITQRRRQVNSADSYPPRHISVCCLCRCCEQELALTWVSCAESYKPAGPGQHFVPIWGLTIRGGIRLGDPR